ncbi:MAG: tRNA (guanosine(37)-N1)-methyltransferase TrmD [Clostridia bacterium]|nr:tRNA (guanosine(37)-N1)-methyltransferase TrmD [Clostridia bacterium]
MKFSIMTLFPEMVDNILKESIIGRARQKGLIEIDCLHIRNYTEDRHRRVDDYPFGGGSGMVMQCQPIYDCYQEVLKRNDQRPHTVYVSPRGKVLTQKKAKELSKLPHLTILCGHYEGVDQRILDEIVDEEISIGDYVLTGGELPACVLIDCISRMIPGVLAEESSFTEESHYRGLLEHPQYTQPRIWKEREVPAVLTEGNHRLIEKWKLEESIAITERMRPDLSIHAVPSGKRIRYFEETDRALFCQMAEAFYNTPGVLHQIPRKHIEDTFQKLLDRDPYVGGYMIRFEQKDAGYCLLSFTNSNEGGGLTVWIEELYVRPEFRGHKLAEKTLRELFDLYQDKAARYRLEVTADNKVAKKIYHKLGFKMLDYQQMIKE